MDRNEQREREIGREGESGKDEGEGEQSDRTGSDFAAYA